MQHEEAIQEVTRLQAEYSSLLGEHEDLIEKFNNQQSETTRLQAEVERLTAQKADAVAVVDETDDGLFIEIIYGDDGSSLRRGDKLYTAPSDRGYVSRLAYDALQSELTKARELLSKAVEDAGGYLPGISEYLSNQSAPADKAPPLIQALHANGDRIAMEATIAQQAQRIADLEADKGQGEPVAWANWKVGTKSYVPYRTEEAASRSVAYSELAATQLGPYQVVPLYAEQPAPVAVVMPFAEKILSNLRRFKECAEDFESGGADIGRHWFDILTHLGLLSRVQRSPALWEITQQGDDALNNSCQRIAFISEVDVSFLNQRKNEHGAWRLNLATCPDGVQRIALYACLDEFARLNPIKQ